MDFADLQSEVGRLLRLEGLLNTDPPPNLGGLVNEALRLFSWEAEYATKEDDTITTVGGTAEYTLTAPPDWKIIKDIYYGSGPGAIPLSRKSEDWMRAQDDWWRIEASTQSSAFWQTTTNSFRLFPPPADAQPLRIFGIVADTDLVNDNDIPTCPSHYHRAIARLAAWDFAEGFVTGQDAVARIQGYYDNAMKQAANLKGWLANENIMGLQRTTKLRAPTRVLLTGEDQSVRSV